MAPNLTTLPAVPMAAAGASSLNATRVVQGNEPPERPLEKGLDEKASRKMISPEDQSLINQTIEDLRQFHAFDKEDSYVCARAMLSALVLGTNNPDKVAKAAGLSRTKIREWFTNLRANQVIEVKRGRSTGVWSVDWFEDHGYIALILDVACAEGLIRRVSE